MFGLFSWIRQQAKNAVLQGVTDAVDELDNPENPPFDPEAWRKRLAVAQPRALPPAKAEGEEPEPTGRKRK